MSVYNDKLLLLSRAHLLMSELEGLRLEATSFTAINDLTCFQILRLSRKKEEVSLPYHQFKSVLTALSALKTSLFYIIKGDWKGIGIYLACQQQLVEEIKELVGAQFTHFDSQEIALTTLNLPRQHAGFVSGLPKILEKEETTATLFPLLQTLLGKEFSIIIAAKSLSLQAVNPLLDETLKEQEETSQDINNSLSQSVALGERQFQKINFHAQLYQERLTLFSKMFQQALASGFWQVQCLLAATTGEVFEQLASVFKGHFSSQQDVLEQLKVFKVTNPEYLDQHLGFYHLIDSISSTSHPLAQAKIQEHSYLNQTLMSTDYLASYFQFPEQEVPGFAIDEDVAFEVTNRRLCVTKPFSIGEIINNGTQLQTPYQIPLNDLTRHTLVIGMTGSGKTNTSKSLLKELWQTHGIPFLVIESAKREYWDLANINERFENLNVFTLGEESIQRGVPYRLNPFEVIGTASIQAHIDRLFATFKASFDLVSPTPFILEQALYAVYEDYGWDIVTGENVTGQNSYPNLTDLILKVDEIVAGSGYSGEILSNIQASLRARLNSLRLGGKGMMLDVERSFPIADILAVPTVLELEDLGDDETKSFVIGLLLTQLYEYRQSYNQAIGSSNLTHLLVIEEAHRLLANETGSDSPKAKAITFFTNLLAEIRSFGQGIYIADQIPTKLASETLKNTNLKLVHRTVMQEDREIIGDAMNMTDEQKSYLSNLRRGTAAVYAEGDSRPKLVRLPLVVSSLEQTREQILYRTYQKFTHHLTSAETSLPEQYQLTIETAMPESFVKQFAALAKTQGIISVISKSKEHFERLFPDASIAEQELIWAHLINQLPLPRHLVKEYLASYRKGVADGKLF